MAPVLTLAAVIAMVEPDSSSTLNVGTLITALVLATLEEVILLTSATRCIKECWMGRGYVDFCYPMHEGPDEGRVRVTRRAPEGTQGLRSLGTRACRRNPALWSLRGRLLRYQHSR